MKKTTLAILASAAIASGCASVGADESKPKQGMSHGGKMSMMAMHMAQMDTNSDGLASREEFMKFHDQMFDMMKNKDGVIDLNNMHGHCKGMMGGMKGGMMGGGHMMQRPHMGEPIQ